MDNHVLDDISLSMKLLVQNELIAQETRKTAAESHGDAIPGRRAFLVC